MKKTYPLTLTDEELITILLALYLLRNELKHEKGKVRSLTIARQAKKLDQVRKSVTKKAAA